MKIIIIVSTFMIALGAAPSAEPHLTLAIGELRPTIDFRLLDGPEGQSINDWERLEGQLVVIDFWATWCAPCIAAFPHLNSLKHRFRDQPVRFFSVTYERADQIETLLAEHELNTEVGLDNDFSTFKSCKAWGIPIVYVFDPRGAVASVVHADNLTAELIEAVLRGEVPQVPQHPGWA